MALGQIAPRGIAILQRPGSPGNAIPNSSIGRAFDC